MIHFQKLRSFIVIISACLTLITLNITGCQPQKQEGPPEKVTIAYSTAGNAILMNIAYAKGFLAKEGLDATPQPYAFGKPALQAVIDGKADIATVGDTPIAFAIMDGKKIMTLAVIQSSNKNEAIVARRGKRGCWPGGATFSKTLGEMWSAPYRLLATSPTNIW